jgi:hypothetical protein
MKGDKRVRLVGIVETEANDPKLSWTNVSRVVISRLGVDVERFNWFSTYRVHHPRRVALPRRTRVSLR